MKNTRFLSFTTIFISTFCFVAICQQNGVHASNNASKDVSSEEYSQLIERIQGVYNSLSKKIDEKARESDYSSDFFELAAYSCAIDAPEDADIVALCKDFNKFSELFDDGNQKLKFIFLARVKWIQSTLLMKRLMFYGIDGVEEYIDEQLVSNKKFSHEIKDWIIKEYKLKSDEFLEDDPIAVVYSRLLALLDPNRKEERFGNYSLDPLITEFNPFTFVHSLAFLQMRWDQIALLKEISLSNRGEATVNLRKDRFLELYDEFVDRKICIYHPEDGSLLPKENVWRIIGKMIEMKRVPMP